MRVLGLMSGTSHDGIDAAVVEFTLDPQGEVLTARLADVDEIPYSASLRADLVAALPPARTGLAAVCSLDTRIGQEFAAVAASVADRAGGVDLVCSHGQTVFHWVHDGQVHGTLQLGNPAWIAERVGVPVVADLRVADVAAGGQGAPLVPLLDELLLAPVVRQGRTAAALNLGGIANVTVCAAGRPTVAFDTGPANALVDAAVAADPGVAGTFDRDGRLAASGTVDPDLLARLLAEPFYARPAPKSSGKELFHAGYVEGFLAGRRPRTADLVATLTELSARTVAAALRAAGVDDVFVSGGGVRNPVLSARITELLPDAGIRPSDALGVPADAKEAVAFALLGWAHRHGLPGNVPSCTGARGPRVLGSTSPGPGAQPVPAPLTRWPGELRIAG